MKLLILLAFCGTVSLMPMENRTVKNVTSSQLCQPQTPCAWTPYNVKTGKELMKIENTYCTCPEGMTCEVTKDDIEVSSYVHHCRPLDFSDDSSR